jgi:GH15 family glucan-1,4-alpha-glucosidase
VTIPQPPPDVPSTPSIGDYGLIGDMRTAALIDRWGRMDWLCWPRFDSPPLLRRLIDPYAGTWQVAPTVPFDAARRYLPDTNVLETTFTCADGVTVTQDFMAVPVEGLGGSRVIRIVEGRSGAVPIRMSLRASRGFRPGTARLGVRDGELGGQPTATCHHDEAMGFWAWLADTAQRHGDDLSVAYTLDGGPLPDESEVKGLAGHRGWGPVRVGDAAGTQRQHDVYGHVLAAASHCYHHMDMESAAPQAVLNRLADLAARRWHRPDDSIWEVRGRRAHHTYSHLMCWLALDRAVDLAAHGALEGDSARWAAQRDAARQAILERAWDPIWGPSPARSAAATSTPPPSSPRSSGSSRPTTPGAAPHAGS